MCGSSGTEVEELTVISRASVKLATNHLLAQKVAKAFYPRFRYVRARDVHSMLRWHVCRGGALIKLSLSTAACLSPGISPVMAGLGRCYAGEHSNVSMAIIIIMIGPSFTPSCDR